MNDLSVHHSPFPIHNFFAQPTLTIARELLGCRLVREIDGQRLSGLIVETEAYIGQEDTACHASKGRTPRTEVMFGPAGQTYVYVIYGRYYMLNFVTEAVEFPAAVLIRAIEPQKGIELMQSRRPQNHYNLANGPGKLCQALGIDTGLNNWPLALGQKLWLEAGHPITAAEVATGPRIGITSAAPKDVAAPWRFWVKGSRFVSN